MAENKNSRSTKTRFSDLRNPVVSSSLLLAIISTVVALYAYFNPRVKTEIAYTRIHSHAVKYDSIRKSLEFQTFDGAGVTSDVYETIFNIWNSGIFPISQDDVKSPFVFSIEQGRIFGVEIVKQSKPSITGFAVRLESSKRAKLTWQNFDPGFGVQVRILHSSSDRDAVSPSAYISNAALINTEKETRKVAKPILLILGISFGLGVLLIVTDEFIEKKFPIIQKKITLPAATLTLFGFLGSIISLGGIFLYFIISYNPPGIFD